MALPVQSNYDTPSSLARAKAKRAREDRAVVIAGLATADAKTTLEIAVDAGVREDDINRVINSSAIDDADAALVLAGLTTTYDLNSVPDRAIADAGADVAASVDQVGVALDGSGSSGTGTVTYQWTQTAGESVTLSDDTVAGPTFTAPSTAQTLTFQLVVTDDYGASRPDTVDVVVS